MFQEFITLKGRSFDQLAEKKSVSPGVKGGYCQLKLIPKVLPEHKHQKLKIFVIERL